MASSATGGSFTQTGSVFGTSTAVLAIGTEALGHNAQSREITARVAVREAVARPR